ncbi:MAG: biopolymer transporter ExbD [Candidatus Cloacimonetes bacterium]|nr:biopolymer transporter ExbD [Candidatus Cloacimonadota bacterium]
MAYKPSQSRSTKASHSSDPPNLVPIMNLFLTIIPMLLFMVVSVQVTLLALNFSGADSTGGPGEGGGGDEEKVYAVDLVIYNDEVDGKFQRGIEIIEEKDKKRKYIDDFNYIELDSYLSEVKKRNPKQATIKITPYDNVKYEHLIRVIDICKMPDLDGMERFPDVAYQRRKLVKVQ